MSWPRAQSRLRHCGDKHLQSPLIITPFFRGDSHPEYTIFRAYVEAQNAKIAFNFNVVKCLLDHQSRSRQRVLRGCSYRTRPCSDRLQKPFEGSNKFAAQAIYNLLLLLESPRRGAPGTSVRFRSLSKVEGVGRSCSVASVR